MKIKPWIPVIAIVSLTATVAVATAVFSKEADEPMSTLTTGDMTQPVTTPPMDADTPVRTETATFALG
jgi:hypothetical protein